MNLESEIWNLEFNSFILVFSPNGAEKVTKVQAPYRLSNLKVNNEEKLHTDYADITDSYE